MSTENAVAVRQDAPKPALRSGGHLAAIVPTDADQAYRMAQMIAQSGMAPKGMEDPRRIVAAIMHGLEVGMKPMQSVQSIAVVNGRPAIWGDAALGLVDASGLLEDFEETLTGEGDKMTATCRAKRAGRKSEIIRTFGVLDAKKAGLWGKGGPWTQYPTRMLQMRARGFCLRDGFADVLKGLSVREEVQDYRAGALDAAVEENRVTLQTIRAEREAESHASPADMLRIADTVEPEPQETAISDEAESHASEAEASQLPLDDEPDIGAIARRLAGWVEKYGADPDKLAASPKYRDAYRALVSAGGHPDPAWPEPKGE